MTPHKHCEIRYGAKQQLILADDTSPVLDATGVNSIQEIIGALLYYALDVDNNILVALSTIGAQQAATTEDTAGAINKLIDYVAKYSNDGIVYRASKIVLAAHSGAGFHKKPKGRSRIGFHIFLSDNDPEHRWNEPVLTIDQIIKLVMTSAA